MYFLMILVLLLLFQTKQLYWTLLFTQATRKQLTQFQLSLIQYQVKTTTYNFAAALVISIMLEQRHLSTPAGTLLAQTIQTPTLQLIHLHTTMRLALITFQLRDF